MMQELGRLHSPEQARQLHLAAGRRQQIVATNHERHALDVVVDSRSELIGPIPVAIAREQIAALLGRPLLLKSMTEIDEALRRRIEAHAETDIRPFSETAVAARARIPQFFRVDERL